MTKIEWIMQGSGIYPHEVCSSAKIKNGLIIRICDHRVEMVILTANGQRRTILSCAWDDTNMNSDARIPMPGFVMSKALDCCGEDL
jgi:hypothetical protein